MIRLHTHPFSTFARRVKIAMLEKNIPHEDVVVDLAKRQQRTPEYLALNPYARVPTLEEDGFVLYESSAILMYLEDEYPEPALVPAGAKGRAEVDMHLRLCDAQMAAPAGTIIFQKRFLPEAKWNLDAIGKASADIARHLAILDRQLDGVDFLVHDRYTLADIAYIPFLHFLPLMVDPATVPANVARWAAELLARASSLETVPAQ
ncbi:MAG: glutathione S-transferase family protein [Gammaproteobacteria bacterium]|uniref:glutathione S-transferase family protein n=1 Tax=Nevskia sp. TaxID=1929292 RepID=UPI0040373D70|nr:glutathione S-transferase family protein [Gammaproteobacteria bacterium]